ncbi:DUF3784 domain-containing protein [Clostridium baratii]|uniref:DUF3784 domain-containing protein n=1 Tax=Clostridium baratii TaxID=1561 RepID=UPI0030D60058
MDMMELGSVLFILLLAAIFWIFKPIRLIAGFMFESDEKINKYNKDKVCKCISIWLVCLSLLMVASSYFKMDSGTELLITIIMVIVLLVVLNSKKMKSNKGVV